MKGKKKESRACEASGHSKICKHRYQKEAFKIQLKDHSTLDAIQKTCCVWINILLQCQYTNIIIQFIDLNTLSHSVSGCIILVSSLFWIQKQGNDADLSKSAQILCLGSQDTEGLGEAAAGEHHRRQSLLSTLHHLKGLNWNQKEKKTERGARWERLQTLGSSLLKNIIPCNDCLP